MSQPEETTKLGWPGQQAAIRRRVSSRTEAGVPPRNCPGGIQVAHGHRVRRNMGQHGRHVDGVAEMVGGGAGAQDGINHLDGIVAAVMVNHQKIVVLDGLDDFPDIGFGELGGHIGGEQTGQGFGHDHAGGAGALLIGTDIGGEEIGGLGAWRGAPYRAPYNS